MDTRYYYTERKYATKEELTKKIYEYFQQLKDEETPNQASLRLFLGITRHDVYHWKNSGKEEKGLGNRVGQDLYEALMIANELLENAAWQDLGARGEWGKFYLARIAGHIEKQKIEMPNADISMQIKTALEQTNKDDNQETT